MRDLLLMLAVLIPPIIFCAGTLMIIPLDGIEHIAGIVLTV